MADSDLLFLDPLSPVPGAAQFYTVSGGTDWRATVDTLFTGRALAGVTVLGIRSTGAAFDLRIANAEVLTANRNLTVSMGNTDRTLTLSGNPTIADWFNQSVKTTASPTFAALGIGTTAAADHPIDTSGTGVEYIRVTSTTTGSLNEGGLQLVRGDAANGNAQVQLYTGAVLSWAFGLRAPDSDLHLAFDVVGGADRIIVTAAGAINLLPGTDIKWGKALVALGGGAAPTLGTIGGGGPATAAQNSWMRVLDSAGAAFWVPVWK